MQISRKTKLELTVFTPTFNRAYCIHQVYDSLLRQTEKNFMWLVVDDGSTDNTRELVTKWQKEKKNRYTIHLPGKSRHAWSA